MQCSTAAETTLDVVVVNYRLLGGKFCQKLYQSSAFTHTHNRTEIESRGLGLLMWICAKASF